MMHGMTALMTEPVAAALIVIDEARGASLTQVARATRRSPSTIQRALDRLLDAGLVVREEPRGRFTIAQNVPHRAVRELAEWQLGDAQCQASWTVRGSAAMWLTCADDPFGAIQAAGGR
jgi:DNA-binding transcriptional ArsR family regulator